MTFDPITQDPPYDSDFPADMGGFQFLSDASAINGVIFTASGESPHPTIILLHGLPGNENNLDLAHIFRRAGFNVAVFHYRGSWGSGGAYRFNHVLEDVQAAVAHFRQPDVAAQYRADPEKIILIGHSLGGWASLMTASQGLVDHACSIAGANIGIWGHLMREEPEAGRQALQYMLSGMLAPLHAVTADDLIQELETNADTWDIVQHTEKLAERNLLLIGGKKDQVAAVFDHHIPLVKLLEKQGAQHLHHTLITSANHDFSSSRIELARTILDWLEVI